jgi:hypothetical protein
MAGLPSSREDLRLGASTRLLGATLTDGARRGAFVCRWMVLRRSSDICKQEAAG